jgi:phosphoribosyl 1,2-cyclic phosphodiesterase
MEKARVTFLGTGGGRFVVMSQLRASGGLILEMDREMLHIDPGPGALVRAKQYRVDLRKVTGILVSHCHPDHYTDVEMVISCMTGGAKKKRGVLLGGENVIRGKGNFKTVASPYFLKTLERYRALKPGEKARIGNIEVLATRVSHGDPKGIGFLFKGSRSVGYVSDTEYFKGLEEPFMGCDCLILNVLRPRKVRWPKHMNTEVAARVIGKVRPKMAVINHFGMIMLRAGPEKEAAWIEKKTGVRTIAAKDGMALDLD